MKGQVPKGRVPEAERVPVKVEDLEIGMTLLTEVGRFDGEVFDKPERIQVSDEPYVRFPTIDPEKWATFNRTTYSTRGLDDPSVFVVVTFPLGTRLTVWQPADRPTPQRTEGS